MFVWPALKTLLHRHQIRSIYITIRQQHIFRLSLLSIENDHHFVVLWEEYGLNNGR